LAAIRTAKKDIGASLAARVDMAMVTVDPERDTAEVLPKYLSSFTDKSHALVPANDAELKAAEAVFLASSSVTKDSVTGEVKVGHSATAYVVDDTGHVVVEWPYGLEAESMAKDLGLLFAQRT
jgi:protein SCO1/2